MNETINENYYKVINGTALYYENYVRYLQQQITQLTNNWNELEEWIMEDVKDEKPDLYFQVLRKIDVLDKMKEIKEGNK